MTAEGDRFLAALRERLELELAGGLDVLPRGQRPAAPGNANCNANCTLKLAPSLPLPLPIHPAADSPLGQLCAEALPCTRCKLATTRTQVVFGVGNPKAALMFVGEAPGADEDEQGEPFVGRAGQLLTKLLKEAGISREEVYIANILKCRPPGNRPPQDDEISQCTPWLRKQLELIRPKIVCALGNFALSFLLGAGGITRMRGKFVPKEDYLVFATYHPSYLFRSPGETSKVQADLKILAEKYRELMKESAGEGRPSH